jgi:predicted phosphodiesterase
MPTYGRCCSRRGIGQRISANDGVGPRPRKERQGFCHWSFLPVGALGMTRLWILSDLHLETRPYPQTYRPLRPDFDVLVVAGDMFQGDPDQALRAVAELASGKPSVFVMGNHEYWNGVAPVDLEPARDEAARLGITLLEGDEAEIGGLLFLGGTLWADGRLGGYRMLPGALTGESIQVSAGVEGYRSLTNADSARLHVQCRTRLETQIGRPRDGRPVVVVTHHAPHPLCMPEHTWGSWPAGNSASDLSHLTDRGLVDLWVHGHTHRTEVLERPGGTRIATNGAGPRRVNRGFRDDFVLSVIRSNDGSTARIRDVAAAY